MSMSDGPSVRRSARKPVPIKKFADEMLERNKGEGSLTEAEEQLLKNIIHSGKTITAAEVAEQDKKLLEDAYLKLYDPTGESSLNFTGTTISVDDTPSTRYMSGRPDMRKRSAPIPTRFNAAREERRAELAKLGTVIASPTRSMSGAPAPVAPVTMADSPSASQDSLGSLDAMMKKLDPKAGRRRSKKTKKGTKGGKKKGGRKTRRRA